MSPLAPEPRPDLAALLARRLARAASGLGRFVFEGFAGLGLRRALPAPSAGTGSEPVPAEAWDREAALRLPWGDALGFPRALAELGTFLEASKVAPGDVVLEWGDGSPGWRSHFLNLYGCPTITVDRRTEALDATRLLFRRHPGTRWDLDPRFALSDGRRIPVADGACERLLLAGGPPHEAPPAEFLAELFRVLAAGGRGVVRVPARRGTTGLEAFAREARRAGFSAVTVLTGSRGAHEVPAEGLRKLLRGRGLLAFWGSFAGEQLASQVVILSKGPFVPTTRRPGVLAGRIEALPRKPSDEPLWLDVGRGEASTLECRLHNTGDTRWLAGVGSRGLGSTRLILRRRPAQGRESQVSDWHELELPRDVSPGESAGVTLALPALAEPGDYQLEVSLEAEGIGSFGPECPPLSLRLQVR